MSTEVVDTDTLPPVADSIDVLRALVEVVELVGTDHVDQQAVELETAVIEAGGYSHLPDERLTQLRLRYAEVPDDGDPMPRCLIGRTLVHLGLPAAELVTMDDAPLPHIDVVEVLGLSLTSDARELLRAAQDTQDKALRWGAVLVSAYLASLRLSLTDEEREAVGGMVADVIGANVLPEVAP